ncbi:BREX-1 system adenine-specific DNA-methyltransferase PglX [Marinobacter salarius]
MSDRQATDISQHIDDYFFEASAEDFNKIPGRPLAYWVSNSVRSLFEYQKLGELSDTRLGMATANNDLFMRQWSEISFGRSMLNANSRVEAESSGLKWFPYQKGGEFRKWYGNLDYFVNWENDGDAIRTFINPETGKVRSHNYNLDYVFREGVTWNALASYKTSARISKNSIFDNSGSSLFAFDATLHNVILAYLNSNLIVDFIALISPTLNYQPGDIGKLPAVFDFDGKLNIRRNTQRLISLSSEDWDFYENSWDFTSLPLLRVDYRQITLPETYQTVRAYWRDMTLTVQKLEEENNRIFIDAYGLQNELAPDVPLEEVTLTCNPHYRYGNNKSEEELEGLLLADTMRELVSYAVGCMFGRYALDKPGLVLANQGETIEDYLKRVPEPSFPADDDNVIPLLDGDWFTDDITERFREFLRIAFGEEHYEENLRFVEQALGKDIRKYFLKDFYNDHVRRYKKRPIYWLFSSPKGSFNALIYMHRCQPHTVGTVLEYLRDFKDEKLQARKNHLEAVSISAGASQGDKTKALKEIEKINRILAELDDYERDVLYPLATEQVEIDLDDGVKANYPKFGEALKKIPGLS